MDNDTTLRIARPSDDIDALLPFYRDGLGLDLLYRFEDHEGFDGLPAFSRDGKKLMWTSSGRTADRKSQLFLADFTMEPVATAASR